MNEFNSDKCKRIKDSLDNKGYRYNGQNLTKHEVLRKRRMLRYATEEDPIRSEVEYQFREDFDIFLDLLGKLDYLKK